MEERRQMQELDINVMIKYEINNFLKYWLQDVVIGTAVQKLQVKNHVYISNHPLLRI
jgi:hypothetical protein